MFRSLAPSMLHCSVRVICADFVPTDFHKEIYAINQFDVFSLQILLLIIVK